MRTRPWTEVELVALDFETTGLDLDRDTIVSYGLVPIRHGRVQLRDAAYQTISPHVQPSHVSITIHELRPKDLADAPTLSEVLEPLRSALDGRFLVTWAAPVEVGFLTKIYGGSQRRWYGRTIDVLPLTVILDEIAGNPTPRDYRLASAAERFGVPVEEAHHALGDALMTAELFLVVATKLAAHGQGQLKQLLRASRAPTRPSPTAKAWRH